MALSVSLTAIYSLLGVVMIPINLTLWAFLYGSIHEILKEVRLGFLGIAENNNHASHHTNLY